MGKRILLWSVLCAAATAPGCRSKECPPCGGDGGPGAVTTAAGTATGAGTTAEAGASLAEQPPQSAAKCVGSKCDESAEAPGETAGRPASGSAEGDRAGTRPPVSPLAPPPPTDLPPAGPLAPGLAAHLTRLPGDGKLVLVAQADVRALFSAADVRSILGGLVEAARREVPGDPSCLVDLAAAVERVTVEAVEFRGGNETAAAILEGDLDLPAVIECAATVLGGEIPREAVAQAARGYVELDRDFVAATLGPRTLAFGGPELVGPIRSGRVTRPLSASAELEAKLNDPGFQAAHYQTIPDFIQELEAADLLETIEESVRKRRFGKVVRLMVRKDIPESLKEMLISNLQVDRNDVYVLDKPLNLRAVMELTRIERHDLKDRPFVPYTPPNLRFGPDAEDDAIFNAIQQENILLHHPYDSFSPVIDFLRTSARDPGVLAIKQTLYRTGSNSPVVKALLQARRDYGKQVAVLVELKARFDEESNITWARLLEQEGVHVTYGLLGLKTHSKVALVVRREGEHIRRYVHLGTGNYNHITALVYEDLSLFTCDDEIAADATDLFNYLTGYSLKENYRKLLVAPINLRKHFEAMIAREIENHQKYGNGHLIFKMNALVDQPIIEWLYRASQAGVKIDLIIRGICCLRPGIKGLSENIRVISIVGRFLEHSRIYYFYNNGDEEVYMGSADLMPRNLNQRVEVLFPIEDKRMIRTIHEDILNLYLSDNVKARLMNPDGTYRRLKPAEGEPAINAQEIFLQRRKAMP